ncbi:MAG: MaoC family dehydratase [Vulcanimicrobiaceae bacterium]
MSSRYYEDFELGEVIVTPGVTLTESSIIDFAFTFDPQRFHIDTEAAEKSPYGGLIASGFQTLTYAFRMFFHLGLINDTGFGSPGIDELRWTEPVRPGDTIRTKVTVLEKRESHSRPDRGIIRLGFNVCNQNDREVMTFTTVAFIARKRS